MKYSFSIKDKEFDAIMDSYNKLIEGVTPAIDEGIKTLNNSLNKAIEAYEASQKNSIDAVELARENGYLRALAGLPLNGSATGDKKPDIKFGDLE
jgi:hypothetical protein